MKTTESLANLLAQRERLQVQRDAAFNPVGQNGPDFDRLNAQISALTVKIEAARHVAQLLSDGPTPEPI